VPRLYDTRNITAKIRDSHSTDFWKWVRPEDAGGATFTLEEPREASLGIEGVVELIKELTGNQHWQGDAAIEKTPNGQLYVTAPPFLHRRVARVTSALQKEALAGVRLSFTLFASAKPLLAGTDADGVIGEEAWEKLNRQADEGGTARRLGSIETVAQPTQTVAAFSGVRRPVAMGIGENGPVASTVPDGLALEACALPNGDRFSVRVRLSYTKVLGIEEIATPKGALRLPRLAEAAFAELRSVPAGKRVVLGTLGPLAAETELPPHVIVVAHLTWVRP